MDKKICVVSMSVGKPASMTAAWINNELIMAERTSYPERRRDMELQLLRELREKEEKGFIVLVEEENSFITGRVGQRVRLRDLAEYLTGDEEVQSITPGLPIPKYPSKVKIYHVHGSIDSPQNMIVTSEDYFRFINSDTYFSRKLSTMLHENTVAILGYSLSDTNLKAIINDYKIFSKGNALCSNIFFISRSEVSQDMKDYYFYCFGIRVIDNTEIDSFFKRLSINIMLIEGVIARARQSIKRVLSGTFNYKDEYLRLEDSFYQITSSIISEGFDWNDGQVVDFFKRIIKQKRDLTRESGAWEQYEQLAKWLIYFGSLLEIGGTKYENEYLDAVEYSMSNMSKEMRLGYSWHAYRAWETRWSTIIASNRLIIKKRIEEIGVLEDANSIVKDIV